MTSNNELSHIALLESLLFVASGPVSTSRLGTALDISPANVRSLLADLTKTYMDRGLRLQWIGQSVQLTSAPEASEVVERFLGLEVTSRLSPAALEVLAIIAYMQPITRPSIDQVRGVNSDGALRTLLSKSLIEEQGRALPGVYKTLKLFEAKAVKLALASSSAMMARISLIPAPR